MNLPVFKHGGHFGPMLPLDIEHHERMFTALGRFDCWRWLVKTRIGHMPFFANKPELEDVPNVWALRLLACVYGLDGKPALYFEQAFLEDGWNV
jgi:hypothetical protein